MHHTDFPVIDLAATGANITRLRKEKGLTVRDMQAYFGFEEPQAIYKWQSGKSLPSVDNLYALGALLGVPMEEILVPARPHLDIVACGQQDSSCCSNLFTGRLFICFFECVVFLMGTLYLILWTLSLNWQLNPHPGQKAPSSI